MNKKKIIIMAGGTGGHIFPGLSIAKKLIKNNWEVLWIGSNSRMESILVPKYKINIKYINVNPICNTKLYKKFFSFIKIIIAFFKACIIINKFKPNISLGMGGYISVAPALASWIFKIPIIIHEQNKIAGIANYWLAKIAKKRLQAFPNTLYNAIVVGNPIRKNILNISKLKKHFINKNIIPLKILVVGGSQGSLLLNNIIPKVSNILKNKIIIWHQTGNKFYKQVLVSYANISQIYKINKFIENIENAYIWADIIICRSGALTVTEIAYLGLPAIFIPFPHKDNQQYYNALMLEKLGAAKIIKECNFTVKNVVKILLNLDYKTLKTMSNKTKKFFIKNSLEKIIHIINSC